MCVWVYHVLLFLYPRALIWLLPKCVFHTALGTMVYGLYHVLWAWCSFSILWPKARLLALQAQKASLIFFADSKRQICRAIAGGRDESCLQRFYSRQHHHWAVHVSSFMTVVAKEQIAHQISSKIQLPKAYYCCVICGTRKKLSEAKANCYNDIHECHKSLTKSYWFLEPCCLYKICIRKHLPSSRATTLLSKLRCA